MRRSSRLVKHYLIEPRNMIFVKGYRFVSFAKDTPKTTLK